MHSNVAWFLSINLYHNANSRTIVQSRHVYSISVCAGPVQKSCIWIYSHIKWEVDTTRRHKSWTSMCAIVISSFNGLSTAVNLLELFCIN